MQNSNKLISIFVILILIFGGLYLFLRSTGAKPLYHQAIKLSLNQLGDNYLELKELKLEATYPEEAKSKPELTAYYQAKVLGAKDKVLFNTQVPKEYLVATFVYPGYQAAPPHVKPNSEIDLYLPFYKSAEKAVIEDELGNTIMSINLKNITSTEVESKQNLCGNSICDTSENRFNCDFDCQ